MPSAAEVEPAQPAGDRDRLGVELLCLLEQRHGLAEGSLVLERPGRRVEPERLGPLAVVDRAGVERDERTRRFVARLPEERPDVQLRVRGGAGLSVWDAVLSAAAAPALALAAGSCPGPSGDEGDSRPATSQAAKNDRQARTVPVHRIDPTMIRLLMRNP